jgi:hypothetical protein
VELGEHFEARAKPILAGLGFSDIKDGPPTAPYDITAVRHGKLHYVAVKRSVSRRLEVQYQVQVVKLAKLAQMENVLFLFIAGETAERWKLVPFAQVQDVTARVRLYSGNLKIKIRTVSKPIPGNLPGRPRTLEGTKLIPLRIDRRLIDMLDEIAKEEGISRQVLMSRVLASAVLRERATARHSNQETASYGLPP